MPNTPATDADTLSPLQWDMRQIHTPEAHAITGGSPAVLVGDIDTGLDFTHPDLAPNVDVADSVNCVSGAPVAGQRAQDDNGHGTHTAGTIAAASNGIGIVGVAPNVRIAGIKAGNDDRLLLPEAVVCAFMWAGTHGIDVTNNSYFADPWLFNCKNDPSSGRSGRRSSGRSSSRSSRASTVVAAEGNASRGHLAPDPRRRRALTTRRRSTVTVTNACVVIPVELPGVIGVTADGHDAAVERRLPEVVLLDLRDQHGGRRRAGRRLDLRHHRRDARRPGADPVDDPADRSSVRRRDAASPEPGDPRLRASELPTGCSRYGWIQGTSMASPHVAGVAALIISQFGKLVAPADATMNPGQVSAMLQSTADAQPCPDTLPAGYLSFLGAGRRASADLPAAGRDTTPGTAPDR